MANPYLFETVNPMDIAMRGFQGIASIRNMQQQSQLIRAQQEEAQARAAAVQAEAARAKEVNDYFAGLASKADAGTITANDYVAAGLRHPEIFEAAMKAAGVANLSGDRARFQENFTPFALLSMGKTEEAKAFFAQRRDAFANAGDTRRAGIMDEFIRMTEQNPLALQLDLGVTAAAADPESFKTAQEMLPAPPSKEPENVRSARAYAMTFGPEGSQEYTTAFREALVRPPAPAAVVNVGGEGFTPGQKKVDEAFASVYTDYITGGGNAVATRVATLNSAIDRLSSGVPLTGPVVGITPEFAEAWINPQATALREDVQNVIVQGLREIFQGSGGYTEQEGTRIVNLAFNRSLSPDENKKRVQRLVAAMNSAMQAKDAAVRYYEDNDMSLRGYRYRPPSIADFESAILGKGPLAGGAPPRAAKFNFQTMSNDALLRLDPQRLSREELDSYNLELDRRGFD